MARVGSFQRWIDWAKKHWIVTIWAALVAFAAGYVAFSNFYATVKAQLAPTPVPEVIQLEAVPPDSLAYISNRTRWMVTVENPSKQPMGITRAHYEVGELDNAAFNANAIELTANVYRLPLDCNSGEGSRPLVPPFKVAAESFATFVIDAGDKDLPCLFRLSFETTLGPTGVMLAKPY